MVPYKRSQSRILKNNGGRTVIRLNDVASAFRYIIWSLAQVLLQLLDLNPVSLILRRWRQLHHLNTRMALSIRPRLIDLATDFFLSDDRRKRKLLSWVKSILPWLGDEMFDFTACWQDGIVLCALMESISPGACPRFNLLKPHHRVNNCRLGIQLATRYLHVTELPLSPEEMAIADDDSEVKILHLVQLLKWKYQKQGSKPTVFSSVTVGQAEPCKCQARGTGIKAGIVGKRTKFNILTEAFTNLDLQIEIRGPNNEYNKEKIISVNAVSRYRNRVKAVAVSPSEDDGKTKVIDDGAGHSFLRQRSLDEDLGHLVIPFDYQCVGEGRFLVTYIPRTAGLHSITVLSSGMHIQGSPFEVKVSDWVSSWNLIPKPRVISFDMLQSADDSTTTDALKPTDRVMRKLSHVAHVSKQLTRMKRRILRKVITANGEEIICDVTPTLSRQNSGDSLLSEGDKLSQGYSKTGESRNRSGRNDDIIVESYADTDSWVRSHKVSGGSNPSEAVHEQRSSSNKSYKSFADAGAAFVPTDVVEQADERSSTENANQSNNSSNAVITSMAATNGDKDKETQKYAYGKIQLQVRQPTKDESMTPEIVITPDCDTYVDALGFFFGEDKQTGVINDAIYADGETNIPLSESFIGVLSSNTDGFRRSAENNSFSEPRIATPSNSFSEVRVATSSNSFSEVRVAKENKKNSNDSFESQNGLTIGSRNLHSKSPSPLLKVCDVVGTLLQGIKQDKREQPISPAHRHYMRSFSVDESRQPHLQSFHSGSFQNVTDPLPSVSNSAFQSPIYNEQCNGSGRQTEPASSSNMSSAVSSSGKSNELDSSLLECSHSEHEAVVERIEPKKCNPHKENTIETKNSNNNDDSLYENGLPRSQNTANGRPLCDEVYCPGCVSCTQGPAINKQDLDERVYEIIEEISERDSLPQEEEISEPSMDEMTNEDTTFDEVIAEFGNDTTFGNKSKSCTDISKEMEFDRFPQGEPTRFRRGHISSSFDFSDFRPKHKITWSQHKSLSEERKSLPNPSKIDCFARNDWSAMTPLCLSNDKQFNAAEVELVSSGCNEGNKHKLDPTKGVNRHYEINVIAKESYNTIYQSNKSNKDCASKNWSHFRAMSLPDEIDFVGDVSCRESQNDSCNQRLPSKHEQLSQMKKWSTFDVPDAVDELDEHVGKHKRIELSQIQKELFNRELYTEEDEILQVILSDVNENCDVGEESLGLASLSYEMAKDMASGNERYISSADDAFSIPDHESKLNMAQDQTDEVMRESPRSDISTKSENSDWSDNDDSTSAVSVKRKSTKKSYLLKGDWSPQFFDLTYSGGVRSRRGSAIKTVSVSSPNRSHDSSIDPKVSILSSNRRLSGSFLNEELENTSGNHIQNGGAQTKGTQCSPELFLGGEFFRSNKSATSAFSNRSTTSRLTDKSHKVPSRFSKIQTISNCKSDFSSCVNNNSVEEIVSNQDAVYIKRRSKPVYTNDSSTRKYVGQASAEKKCHTNSTNIMNNNHQFTDSKPCSNCNAKYRHEAQARVCDLNDSKSFFSTLEMLSPDQVGSLHLDNWSLLNNSYADGLNGQTAQKTNEHSVYALGDSIHTSGSGWDNIWSRVDYFRERLLTPTKYRLQERDTLKHFKRTQELHDTRRYRPQDTSNMCSTDLDPEQTDSWVAKRGENIVKLVVNPGSVMVSLSPGDRILTPTKHRHRRRADDNFSRKATNGTEAARRRVHKEYEQFNEESDLNSDSESSYRDRSYHKETPNSCSRRYRSNKFQLKSEFLCEFCDKSFTLSDSKMKSQMMCPVCAGISKDEGRQFNLNILPKYSNTSLKSNVDDLQNIHASRENCMGCNVDDLQNVHASRENYMGASVRCKSLVLQDRSVDENDVKPYVKKRRKMIHGDNVSARNNLRHSDNNKFPCVESNTSQIGDTCFEPLFDLDRQVDLVLAPRPYIDRLDQQQLMLEQHSSQHNKYHYTAYDDYQNQQPSQKGLYPCLSQHQLNAHQQQPSTEYQNQQYPMPIGKLKHACNQTSAWCNLQSETQIKMQQQQHSEHHDQNINQLQQQRQSDYPLRPHSEHDQNKHQHDKQQHDSYHNQNNQVTITQQDQQQQYIQQPQQHQPLRSADESRDHREVVIRRQSTVDTLDSGIPDDSTQYCLQTSYQDNDSLDSRILDIENGFDFNIFLEP